MIHSDSDSSIYSDEDEDVSLGYPDRTPSVQTTVPTPTSSSVPSPTTSLPSASPQTLATHQRTDSRGSASQLAPGQGSENRSCSPRSRSPSPGPGGSNRRRGRSNLVSKEDLKKTPRGKRESVEREMQLGQEQIRDKRLLYVLVARCIAFPIMNRPKVGITVPPTKLRKDHYEELLKRFRGYLAAGDTTKAADKPDYLRQCVKLFHERVLLSTQVTKLAEDGNISSAELKLLFAVFAHRQADLLTKSEESRAHRGLSNVDHTSALWVAEVESACFADEVSLFLLPLYTYVCVICICESVCICMLCTCACRWGYVHLCTCLYANFHAS